MRPENPHFYEFGPFRLDPCAPLLLRDGHPVSLTLKALETLLYLVEHRGRVVSRDELIEAVWPNVAVEENNLSVNVSAVRKVLGEKREGEKYIETVPRRGYRFIATVRDVAVERAEQIYATQSQPSVVVEPLPRAISTPAQRVSRATNGLLLALSVLLATGCVAYLFSRSSDEPTHTGLRSIAVLPLKAISENKDDEALSLGLAESLITRLGGTQRIIVRPLSLITSYAGAEYDALEVGRKLRVDAILDGSFQRNGDRLRVSVTLFRVADGKPVWAGTFDEVESDIFKLQDTISLAAASALALNIDGPERALILKRYTENKEAYHAYLRGRYYLTKREDDDRNFERAFAEYERALRLDPQYALAYAGLADAYSRKANVSSGDAHKQCYEKAKTAALTALALDENLAEAHCALGWIRRIHDWDWTEAEKHLKRAIELAPNEPAFRRYYAYLLITLGDTASAVAQARKAYEVDPTVVSYYAWALACDRQIDAAIVEFQKSTELNADSSAWHELANLHLQKGAPGEALQIIDRTPQKEKEGYRTRAIETMIYFRVGVTEKAEELLRRLETEARAAEGRDVRLAAVYASLGRKDDAIGALQRGFAARDDRLMWIKTNPHFDSLRSDPRFQEILHKMRL
jgi:DNA-binding winged helix-turn-helix (wHTH) protein/TolB-like protein/cytochrome c-type biogenesis protein CcmH/NrfG